MFLCLYLAIYLCPDLRHLPSSGYLTRYFLRSKLSSLPDLREPWRVAGIIRGRLPSIEDSSQPTNLRRLWSVSTTAITEEFEGLQLIMPSLFTLPAELVLKVSEYLPHYDATQFSASCQRFRYELAPSLWKDVSVALYAHKENSGPDSTPLVCMFVCINQARRLHSMISRPQSLLSRFTRQLTVSVQLQTPKFDTHIEATRMLLQRRYGACGMCETIRELCWRLESLEVFVIQLIPLDNPLGLYLVSFFRCTRIGWAFHLLTVLIALSKITLYPGVCLQCA